MTERKILVLEDRKLTAEQFFAQYRGSDEWEEEDRKTVERMLREAAAAAVPKAVYGVARIEEKGKDYVVADGIRIVSPLVRGNLDGSERIIPFVATCGTELAEWAQQFRDPLEAYWADGIMLQYLMLVRQELMARIREAYFPAGDMSAMNPGSLAAWPLPEQEVLFRLVGGVTESIGVRLTDSFLMLPSKSSSGFLFSAESHYENCQFCPLENCPGRRAPRILQKKAE